MKRCLVLLVPLFMSTGQVLAQNENTLKMVKQPPLLEFDYNKPLFLLSKEQQENKNGFLRFSIFTGYREGVLPTKSSMNGFDTTVDKENGTIRIYMINKSIQELLNLGFPRANNRVILEVKDSSKYRYESSYGTKVEWMRKNAYCFEYLFPEGSIKDIKTIKEELSNFFHVSFGSEKRIVDVLTLIRTSDKDKIKSPGAR